MAGVIPPTAKALYLCDYHVGYSNGKVDLYGLFNAVRPRAYPHTLRSFICFAQLRGGLGNVPFYIDIRRAADGQLIDWTPTRQLRFPDRETLVQVVVTVSNVVFDRPGIYLVELYCDNACVADTTVLLEDLVP